MSDIGRIIDYALLTSEFRTVISTADHETGGLVLAATNFTLKDVPGPCKSSIVITVLFLTRAGASNTFPKIWYPEVINRVKMSTEKMTNLYVANNMDLASFKQLVYDQTGQELTAASMDRLLALVDPVTQKLNSSLASRFEYTISEVCSLI